MDSQFTPNLFEKRRIVKSTTPAVKWFKEWVPQDIAETGGKRLVLKWVTENQLKALKERGEGSPELEPEPEATTERLYLCTAKNCQKVFPDIASWKKHSHSHAEKQHICSYKGCEKKFSDASKLKRHLLTHTGQKDFICPECGKGFSLDFNLKSHMKTHSPENYFLCPYPECGKRYAHEYKLNNHISSYHEKRSNAELVKHSTPEKRVKLSKPSPPVHAVPTPERPYACPYVGCLKAYIHEYKLKLHLRNAHAGHVSDENPENPSPIADNYMNEAFDPDAYAEKSVSGSSQKRSLPKSNSKMPPAKLAKLTHSKGSSPSPIGKNVVKSPWPIREETYINNDEGDSEETEEDEDLGDTDGRRYVEPNDDEETDYED